jgi:hypothetical protein
VLVSEDAVSKEEDRGDMGGGQQRECFLLLRAHEIDLPRKISPF